MVMILRSSLHQFDNLRAACVRWPQQRRSFSRCYNTSAVVTQILSKHRTWCIPRFSFLFVFLFRYCYM